MTEFQSTELLPLFRQQHISLRRSLIVIGGKIGPHLGNNMVSQMKTWVDSHMGLYIERNGIVPSGPV